MKLFAPAIAFVDLETTGTRAADDRITEIGIVRVDADPGGAAPSVREWSTLVDPEAPIPPAIQALTGINDAMVRGAPTFDAVAGEVMARLDGCVFVAHNARFDYGFLKHAFARTSRPFTARVLCTVKLSRRLFPDAPSHGLDAVIERHGLDVAERHRALGDARALWLFAQALYACRPADVVDEAVQRILKIPSLPPQLAADALDALPEAPGVYLFYGLNEHPIYVGKSVDLRARVASHFNAEHRTPRDLRLSQEIHRLEWEETAGEFGALLRESELVKTRLPAHNVALRRRDNQVIMELDEHARPQLSRALDFDLARLGASYGPFSSRAAARQFLVHLAGEHALCLKTLGLEGRRSAWDDGVPCFNRQLSRCQGACVGDEPREAHAARLREALEPQRLPAWPHGGAVALVERNAGRFREDWHVFDRWCWLGTVKTIDAARALAATSPRVFEADAARLAIRASFSEPPWPLERVDLGLP